MLELAIMILALLCLPIIVIGIIGIIGMIEDKHQKPNRNYKEIVSIAMKNVEDCNTDDLEDMIRYFEEQEEQVRYKIQD